MWLIVEVLRYKVNAETADDLATKGAMASAAMVLTYSYPGIFRFQHHKGSWFWNTSNWLSVAWWCHITTLIWVNNDSDNTWTNVDLSSVTSIWRQFHKIYLSHQSLKSAWKYFSKISFKSPRGQWINQINGLVQDCSNYIANALELVQPCNKPSNDVIVQTSHWN